MPGPETLCVPVQGGSAFLRGISPMIWRRLKFLIHLIAESEVGQTRAGDRLFGRFRLTNHMVGGVVPALGLMVGYFRANHAAGVISRTRFAGKFSKPGRTALRYSSTGTCSLRHVLTIEMIAATRGPACSIPT